MRRRKLRVVGSSETGGAFQIEADARSEWIADPEGDELRGNEALEITVNSGVRVLISRSTSSADAVRLLRKIANWIERVGLDVACAEPPGGPDG